MRWGVVLCTCNDTLRFDPERIGTHLGLERPPAVFARLPRDEIHALVDRLSREGLDRVAVGCCGPPDLFREAMRAAGGDPAAVLALDLKARCFWTHAPGPDTDARAARLLRAAMREAESARPAPERSVRGGGTVLIATDSPAGLHLARRVESFGQPVLVLDERSAAFDADPVHPLPWRANWGRVVDVAGTLGSFRVSVERTQPLSLETCVVCRRCVPVCHTQAISEGLRLRTELCDRCGDCLQACEAVGAIRIPRQERDTLAADQVVEITDTPGPAGPTRTGHHVLRTPAPSDLDALAWKIFSLVGDFRRPEYVAYDAAVCAGGAAGHATCGACIPACPYHAIERNPREPLRVLVDPAACEGCGACVSACPTSALAFQDPPAAALHARMAALLAPLPGRAAERPLVLAFHCPEEGERILAQAGRQRLAHAPTVLPVPMACLRHVSEADVLAAFRLGAAGVALVGCEACPHGERTLLTRRLDVARAVLDAFGAGGDRVQVLTGSAGEARALMEALDRFATSVGPAPLRVGEAPALPAESREVVAETVRALVAAAGRAPGPVPVGADETYAVPEVKVADCTLSRACVNVCPTHAFRFDEAGQTLQLKPIACVNCGLCVKACPERAITLRAEIPLSLPSLDWRVVVRDEPARCTRCGKAFGGQKVVEVLEARLLSLPSLLDTFTGARRGFLRMCPECRAVAAMREVEQGWEP